MNQIKKHFTGESFDVVFKNIATELHQLETMTSPRGQATKEFLNLTMIIEDPTKCVLSSEPRKLSHKYLKAEFDWYLSKERSIEAIKDHSKMWSMIADQHGQVNSNYGYFAFENLLSDGSTQMDWCINSLIDDTDSRQSVMNFNNVSHKVSNNKDFVCTLSQQFFIRNNELISIVNMRSCDLIYGASFDIPYFSFLQQFVFKSLLNKYPTLKLGKLIHNSGSMHVYERHFEMIKKISETSSTPDSIRLSDVFGYDQAIQYFNKGKSYVNWPF